MRGAYGIYYDQPLVGIFEQNSFTTPPVVNNVTLHGARASATRPAGQTPTTTGVRTIIATATDFENPRTHAVERRRHAAALEPTPWSRSATSGSRGDNLIRPTDINYPQPADVVALQSIRPADGRESRAARTARTAPSRSARRRPAAATTAC